MKWKEVEGIKEGNVKIDFFLFLFELDFQLI